MSFLLNFLCVCLGASLGASLRWGITYWFNQTIPSFPLGTLLCNVVGGLGVGIALALFLTHDWSPQARLFIITGLLGGLTTFSTFSSEVSMLLMREAWLSAILLASAHLFGSLLMTVVGFSAVKYFFH